MSLLSGPIIHYQTSVAGRLPDPVNMDVGSLAKNTADRRVWSKDALGELFEITNYSALDPTRDGRRFGVSNMVGNGVVDDAARWSAFLAAIPDRSVVVLPGGREYRFASAPVDSGKSVTVFAHGARIKVVANVVPLRFGPGAFALRDLSANYTAGSLTLSLASALPRAPAAGEVIKITSDAVDPANRDSGSATQQYRCGEYAICGVGSTTTSIVLSAPLRFIKGVSPTSVAGDEAIVDCYTTALNAKVTLYSGQTLSWFGGEIEFEAGHEADPWTAGCMTLTGLTRPIVQGLEIIRGYGPGIGLYGCANPLVADCHIANLTNNTSLNQFGYGVGDASFMTQVDRCVFAHIRHGYTTSDDNAGLDPSSAWQVGRVTGAVIRGCVSMFSTGALFDTHHGAQDITFEDCWALNGNIAFTVRGRNVNIIRPRFSNVAQFIFHYTEYDSGDPNDDLFTAGKPSGLSTCTVDSARGWTNNQTLPPYSISASRLIRLTGVHEVESPSARMMLAVGSRVEIDGKMRFRYSNQDGAITTSAQNGANVFEVDPINAALTATADFEAGIRFMFGSHVEVDVSGAAGTGITLFYATDATCFFDYDGAVDYDLPAGAAVTAGPSGSHRAGGPRAGFTRLTDILTT